MIKVILCPHRYVKNGQLSLVKTYESLPEAVKEVEHRRDDHIVVAFV